MAVRDLEQDATGDSPPKQNQSVLRSLNSIDCHHEYRTTDKVRKASKAEHAAASTAKRKVSTAQYPSVVFRTDLAIPKVC